MIFNANYITSEIEASWPGSVHDVRIVLSGSPAPFIWRAEFPCPSYEVVTWHSGFSVDLAFISFPSQTYHQLRTHTTTPIPAQEAELKRHLAPWRTLQWPVVTFIMWPAVGKSGNLRRSSSTQMTTMIDWSVSGTFAVVSVDFVLCIWCFIPVCGLMHVFIMVYWEHFTKLLKGLNHCKWSLFSWFYLVVIVNAAVLIVKVLLSGVTNSYVQAWSLSIYFLWINSFQSSN